MAEPTRQRPAERLGARRIAAPGRATLIIVVLLCSGCTGGTYIRFPSFPDSSCSTCASSGERERPN